MADRTVMYPDNSFGELLNLVEMNYQLACDQEAGNCGKPNYIHHFLSTPPHVFTTVLGWQNTCESTDDILATLAALTPELYIGVLYCGLDLGKKHCLVSVVFNCFGQQFCLHFEAFLLGVAPVYMAFLRFMGDENEAKNFSYSQEVGGNGRKLTWQGVPRSIRDNHRKVRDNYDGLVIHRNMALFFSGGNRQELKLQVTSRIWKEQ